MGYIVGKKYVCYTVALYIVSDIRGEVSAVYDMNLLKRTEQKGGSAFPKLSFRIARRLPFCSALQFLSICCHRP